MYFFIQRKFLLKFKSFKAFVNEKIQNLNDVLIL